MSDDPLLDALNAVRGDIAEVRKDVADQGAQYRADLAAFRAEVKSDLKDYTLKSAFESAEMLHKEQHDELKQALRQQVSSLTADLDGERRERINGDDNLHAKITTDTSKVRLDIDARARRKRAVVASVWGVCGLLLMVAATTFGPVLSSLILHK